MKNAVFVLGVTFAFGVPSMLPTDAHARADACNVISATYAECVQCSKGRGILQAEAWCHRGHFAPAPAAATKKKPTKS